MLQITSQMSHRMSLSVTDVTPDITECHKCHTGCHWVSQISHEMSQSISHRMSRITSHMSHRISLSATDVTRDVTECHEFHTGCHRACHTGCHRLHHICHTGYHWVPQMSHGMSLSVMDVTVLVTDDTQDVTEPIMKRATKDEGWETSLPLLCPYKHTSNSRKHEDKHIVTASTLTQRSLWLATWHNLIISTKYCRCAQRVSIIFRDLFKEVILHKYDLCLNIYGICL